MYDYWLGGKDNFAADRMAARAALAAYPGMARLARENRAFLRRVVRYLAGEAGVRQFLDIGTGIPTAGNTHEIAQEVAPECRVVYVDYDPVVLTHARALLASKPEGTTAYLDADLRDTVTLLEKAAQTLDFTEPVAVTMLAVLHAVGDEDDPHAIVARIMRAVPSGSYLASPTSRRSLRPSNWTGPGTASTASATSSTPTAATPRSCDSSTAWSWSSPDWWSCGTGGPPSKPAG